jgi:hypothetical protein
MTRIELSPAAEQATSHDLRAAQHQQRLLKTELPRVREAATAWRNGLGALLAALIGFGLIKGRSDVGRLASGWAAVVGVILLLALAAGAVGALLLLRAAHGSARATDTRDLRSPAADHIETLASARALRQGRAATVACAVFLVAAVAATWYGPEKADPGIRVTGPSGTVCGSVVRTAGGALVLKTDAGEVTTDLSNATAIQAVDACDRT